MGADTRQLKARIRSVDATLHLTKAMGLVASSKMRRAAQVMQQGKQYEAAVQEIMKRLSNCPECCQSPYLEERKSRRTRLIVIAGDRGLAGGYNHAVFQLCKKIECTEYIPIGKKAYERYHTAPVCVEKFSYPQARQMAERLCEDFAKGQYDRLGIVTTRYVSMFHQEAEIRWLLPIEREEEKAAAGILFEPDGNTVFHFAVLEYVTGMIYGAVSEGYACETVARRMAMDSASRNAQQMTEDLQLRYNQARQAAITQEITEIVAGSGA